MWRKEDVDESLEQDQVLAELQKDQGDDSLRNYANRIGCSASYLHQVYNGVRPPSDTLLNHLNLERRVIYVRKTDNRRWR